MRKLKDGDSGLQLRRKEDALMTGVSKSDPSTGGGPQSLHLIFIYICLILSVINIHDYYALCRGETLPHSCTPALAQCHLTSNQQPYLMLAPIRVETVCQEPSFVIFHDILSPEEMRYMKASARKSLAAAAVAENSSGEGKKVAKERTQSNAWLFDQVVIS